MKKVIFLFVLTSFGLVVAISVSSWLLATYGNIKTIRVQTITVKKPVATPKQPSKDSSQTPTNIQGETVILTEPPYQTTVTNPTVEQYSTPAKDAEIKDSESETEENDD